MYIWRVDGKIFIQVRLAEMIAPGADSVQDGMNPS